MPPKRRAVARRWSKDSLSEHDFAIWLAGQKANNDVQPKREEESEPRSPLTNRKYHSIEKIPPLVSVDSEPLDEKPESREEDEIIGQGNWDNRFEEMCQHLYLCFPQGLDGVNDNELFNRAEVNRHGWQWYHSTKLMTPLFFDVAAAGFPLKPKDSNVLANSTLVHQQHIFLKYDLVLYIRQQFRHFIRRRESTSAFASTAIKLERDPLKDEHHEDSKLPESSLKIAAGDTRIVASPEVKRVLRPKRRKRDCCYESSLRSARRVGDYNFYISCSNEPHSSGTDKAGPPQASDDDDSVVFVSSANLVETKVFQSLHFRMGTNSNLGIGYLR